MNQPTITRCPKPQPKRRGQIVRVTTGTDAGKRAIIIQEPLPGSTTHTIQFSDGRAVVLPAAHTAPEQEQQTPPAHMPMRAAGSRAPPPGNRPAAAGLH